MGEDFPFESVFADGNEGGMIGFGARHDLKHDLSIPISESMEDCSGGWGPLLDDLFDTNSKAADGEEEFEVPVHSMESLPVNKPTFGGYSPSSASSVESSKGEKRQLDTESKFESDGKDTSKRNNKSMSDGSSSVGSLEKGDDWKTSIKREVEDGTSRKARNREACRRHRQKKRKEMESLRLRRSQLEKERGLYLSRIAELQTEVEALRYGGAVDLAKENYLLRAEIMKHKVFVQNIIDATRQNTPSKRTPEEQMRMIRNGLESGKRQIIGLGYSSAVDPSWNSCQPLPRLDGAPGDTNFFIKYQRMPIGADCGSTNRLNLRVDLLNIPISAKAANDLFLAMVAEPQRFEYHHREKAKRIGVEVSMENILPEPLREIANQMGEGESVHVHRYSETKTCKDGSKQTNEAFLALEAGQGQVAVPAIFRRDHIEQGLLGADSELVGFTQAYIGCSTSCHAAFDQAEFSNAGARTSTAAMLKGHILIPTGPNSCHFISLGSHPISPDSFKTLEDPAFVIDEEGRAKDYLIQSYRDLRKLFVTEGVKFMDPASPSTSLAGSEL